MKTIPSKQEIESHYASKTDDEIGDIYSVSAASVRRWRRRYHILSRSTGPRTIRGSRVSDDEIRQVVPQCFSIAAVCRAVGLVEAGANHRFMKDRLTQLNLDTSHFGQQISILGHKGYGRLLETYLVKGSKISSCALKGKLLKANLLKEVCALCEMEPIWQGEKLVLHLDHIDGDSRNNVLSNLRLLCPNCHSQTLTYCGKNIGKDHGSVAER